MLSQMQLMPALTDACLGLVKSTGDVSGFPNPFDPCNQAYQAYMSVLCVAVGPESLLFSSLCTVYCTPVSSWLYLSPVTEFPRGDFMWLLEDTVAAIRAYSFGDRTCYSAM